MSDQPTDRLETAASGGRPAVDVIVPTRDRPDLLNETVDAILGQTYDGAVRVIVVYDQAEPDLTIAREGETRSVHVVTNRRTPGLAGARNSGIEAASAPIVAFCDDDDVWQPSKLDRQIDVLVSEPQTVLVSIGIDIDYDGRSIDRSLTRAHIELSDLLRSRLTELHPSTFVMRRAPIVESIGMVDEHIPGSYAEDYEFLLRIARAAPIAVAPGVGVMVRWHKRSYFSQRWAMIEDALTWLLERYPEFETVPEGHARVLGQIAFAVAAQGRRGDAVRLVGRTLRTRPTEARGYLALAVAGRAVSADRVLRTLHRHGRGL